MKFSHKEEYNKLRDLERVEVYRVSELDSDLYFLSSSLYDVMNKIEFNSMDCDIIPYYPIELYDISSEPIKEVILGPKNNILERDFELYAAKYNMKNIVLRRSEISFRG